MNNEAELLKKLEHQIAGIEQFILNLQQDNTWQHVFYKNKLYLKLNSAFEKNYTEYSKYLEDIIKDFKKISLTSNHEIKQHYIAKVEYKIFALIKILRSLKNFDAYRAQGFEERIRQKQVQAYKFMHQAQSLEKMLEFLEKQYAVMHKQLIYGQEQKDLKQKLLNLLHKKANLEKELFSVKQMLALYA